jgi:hypothetical protein
MSEFSMDAVVELLRERGVANAHVEQTGGGVATIFAGPTYEEPDYGTRYAVCAGPGRYGPPNVADTTDFYVGPDDDGGNPDGLVTVDPDWTVEQVTDAIETQANNHAQR